MCESSNKQPPSVTYFILNIKGFVIVLISSHKFFFRHTALQRLRHQIQHIPINLGTKFHLNLTILPFWIKFVQKGYFWSKRENLNITTEFSMFELASAPSFILNRQFWIFGQNLPTKRISRSKQDKWTLPPNSDSGVSVGTKFHLKQTVLIVWSKFTPKRVFPVQSNINEHYHQTRHIQITLGTNFHLKHTIFIFCTEFSQKGYFWSKTEKANITIEFCIFELV